MDILKKSVLLTLLLLIAVQISSQVTDSLKASFDFENGASKWTTETPEYWNVTDSKAASGTYSMSYLVSDDFVASPVYSINTGLTIMKVRTAKSAEGTYIVGSSYEGTVIGLAYDGAILWKNQLSGYMNHDIWCEDISGDGIDEVLIANANGTIYCLNDRGAILWQFKKNEAPMYAVCVIEKDDTPYVVCGGFDMSFYYLSAAGEFIKEIKSSTYSLEKPWSKFPAVLPPDYVHTVNFLRPVPKADGSIALAVHGTNNQMNVPGTMYMFEPLADLPYRKDKVTAQKVLGDFRVYDTDDDGIMEIILGTSVHTNESGFSVYSQDSGNTVIYEVNGLTSGYIVTQTEKIKAGNSYQILVLAGSEIRLVDPGLDVASAEKLYCKYAFNDMWKDQNDRIILASAQSGGSCIHIVDTQNPDWKIAYSDLNPPGKIDAILKNTAIIRENLQAFSAPDWEGEPKPVYLMTEIINTSFTENLANDISNNYSSPIFLNGVFMPKVQSAESWSRDTMSNEKYRLKRDRRKQYILDQQEVLDMIEPEYAGFPGISYWGGHGNDPFFYHPETTKKVIDFATGKKTVLIYPEVGDHSEDFLYVADNLIKPLASHAQGKNTNMFIRSKGIFWQGPIYLPGWSSLLSGEFADVFVPAMEETSDKTMELSVAGRLGIWTSGAVDQWGTRCARDNTSYDRSREHSNQMVPNHFLRMLVYHLSSGATYLNNFRIDQDYISIFWELIAKGVLYIPESNEIVSFSPVHLGMKNPDDDYIDDGTNIKWTTFYDEDFEENNPFVFSRMNGTWPGAPVTEWDFSRYAAGVNDRRLNFLPPYENGLVLITPPQNGLFADETAPRGALTDHLHPMYKDIMKEYITDGRHYYSADGSQTFAADEYYTTIEDHIQASKSLLPLTVSGDVAWVVAQTSPTHLRLTVIDGGYINPDDRVSTISFHTVTPVKMLDMLDGESFDISDPSEIKVDVPCGAFRFIDIELSEALE